MRHATAIIGAVLLVAGSALGSAQVPKPAAPGSGTAEADRPGPSRDEQAIRAADEAFTRAYNAGDAHALAEQFTKVAEVVDVDGLRYRGRDAIEQLFAATFRDNPGVTIAMTIDSLRFLGPEVAKEEGSSTITPARGGVPVSRRYTVLFVKQGERWLQDSVREEPEPRVRPHDRLKELEWMVGDWVDEGPDSEVRVQCRWSADTNFLIRTFAVKHQGKTVMTVTQRIGWDPLARQIRSWEFDSEGGFGEGRWSRDGTRWVVKHTGVRPEGLAASATNILSKERPDLVRWVSTERVMGDESIPEDVTYVLVRVPPAPSLPARGPATPVPSPNTTRSPR
jgi:uncharacterized protein (TIGR02246 family)